MHILFPLPWNSLLPLVNSTLSFISYLKYQQLIWEAFLRRVKTFWVCLVYFSINLLVSTAQT